MANPYHDKEGKFTSRENQGQAEPNVETKVSKIKFKEGIDLSAFPLPNTVNSVNQVQKGGIDTNFELTMPKSIDDANAQGNKILGSNVIVKYDSNTNLEQAFEMNKGLKAVVSDFPELFTDDMLLSYGTGIRENRKFFTFQEQKDILDKIYNRQEYVEVKNNLSKSGIDFDSVKNLFLNGAVLTENIKPFNFMLQRNKGTGGVTKTIGSKLSGLRTPDGIQINPDYMSNDIQVSIIKTRPVVQQGHFLPWGDKTPTFATSAHELGHHCYNQLQNFFNSNERQELFDLTAKPKKWFTLGEISGYATTSKDEQIAEAFSDFYCRGDNATKHNRDIIGFFKKVYKRVYGF